MATPPWPERCLSFDVEGSTTGRVEGVLKILVVTKVEDWSTGLIPHSMILNPTNPSRVTLGLGRGWEKEMISRPSNVPKEAIWVLEELRGSLFVSAWGRASFSVSSTEFSSSSSENNLCASLRSQYNMFGHSCTLPCYWEVHMHQDQILSVFSEDKVSSTTQA